MGSRMMEYQKPAENIMLTHDFKDAKFYSVNCSCTNPDDKIDLEIEADEYGEIVVYFHTTAKTHWWKTLANWETHKIDNPFLYLIVNSVQSLINGLHQRIKLTKEIWWNGYISLQTTTILTKQTALNFSETLKDAVKEIEIRNDKH
jgi:hypothetical protein